MKGRRLKALATSSPFTMKGSVPQTGALLGLPGDESPVLGRIPGVTNEAVFNQVGEEGGTGEMTRDALMSSSVEV